MQAVSCLLADIVPPAGQPRWSKENIACFKAILLEQNVYSLQAKKKSDGQYVVKIQDQNGKTISLDNYVVMYILYPSNGYFSV